MVMRPTSSTRRSLSGGDQRRRIEAGDAGGARRAQRHVRELGERAEAVGAAEERLREDRRRPAQARHASQARDRHPTRHGTVRYHAVCAVTTRARGPLSGVAGLTTRWRRRSWRSRSRRPHGARRRAGRSLRRHLPARPADRAVDQDHPRPLHRDDDVEPAGEAARRRRHAARGAAVGHPARLHQAREEAAAHRRDDAALRLARSQAARDARTSARARRACRSTSSTRRPTSCASTSPSPPPRTRRGPAPGASR